MNIPLRFSKARFEEYDIYWLTILSRMPEETVFTSKRVKPETLIQRLREARQAQETYHWSKSELWLAAHKVQFTSNNDQIIAFLKGTRIKDVHQHAEQITAQPEIHFTGVGQCQVFLAEMISNHCFNPPLTFILDNPEPTLSNATAHLDVVLTTNEKNQTILV
jgi:hypothetical protein